MTCTRISIFDPRPRFRRYLLPALLGLCLHATAALGLVEMSLDGDRLWLQARAAPLSEILAAFSRMGVAVEMDPAIRNTYTVDIKGEDLETTMGRLLDGYTYILLWQQMDGPLGPLPRLTQIQVFQPGMRHRAHPINPDVTRFNVARDNNGREFIADEIVIGFAPGQDPRALRTLIRELGGTIVESIPEIGIYRVQLPPGTNVPALIEQLQRNPLVGSVEPNYAYRLPERHGADASPPAANTRRITRPSETTPPVAILDSGLNILPDLEGLVRGGYNALQPDLSPTDTAGHGTQMALIASGAIAPAGAEAANGMPIFAIRAFDEQGVTSNFAMMRSIFQAQDAGAKVLNLSWGSEVNSAFLAHSIETAARAGLLMVAAAGNEPTSRPVYPAAYAEVIGVSAALPDGSPWPQSNFGDFVTVAAPGTAFFPIGFQGEAGAYAGTSIASAYVAHALGHYMAQHPNAKPDQAVAALKRAVHTDANRTPQTGYGILTPDAIARLLNTAP
jgi:thermitase